MQIYKEEIFAKAKYKGLDHSPREVEFHFEPPTKYESGRIDANGDWFNEDAGQSA